MVCCFSPTQTSLVSSFLRYFACVAHYKKQTKKMSRDREIETDKTVSEGKREVMMERAVGRVGGMQEVVTSVYIFAKLETVTTAMQRASKGCRNCSLFIRNLSAFHELQFDNVLSVLTTPTAMAVLKPNQKAGGRGGESDGTGRMTGDTEILWGGNTGDRRRGREI